MTTLIRIDIVHIEQQENGIRIISARKATRQEKADYES